MQFSHIFDTEVGMTGVAELAEVDGPFVKIRLKGRFWHERSLVLARLGNYLKERIPEILEVDIEDEKQLDDSPENFLCFRIKIHYGASCPATTTICVLKSD
ncbi:uncharacterized protein LOC143577875 [Bidens hawaiensis]|uniref:uncharacterized protein LOC143577875 n=1 Tax=Bidens hawaiensis TaxID=980011 RepID=UPI004049A1D7